MKICSDVCCAMPDVCGQLLGAFKAICLPTSRKPAFQQLVEKVAVRKMSYSFVFESMFVCLCMDVSVCISWVCGVPVYVCVCVLCVTMCGVFNNHIGSVYT